MKPKMPSDLLHVVGKFVLALKDSLIFNGMHKFEEDKKFKGKVRKNFFKSESERNLWVKLNAEAIRHFHETINHKEREELGDIDTPYSYMWISNNQLIFDEYERDAPRFSFEELLTLSMDDLVKITRRQHMEFIRKTFKSYLNKFDEGSTNTDL